MKKLGKKRTVGLSVDIMPYLTQAHTDYQAGRFEAAVQAYQYILRLHPELSQLYTNLGAAQQQAAQVQEAIVSFQKALQNEPNAQAFYNLAGAFKEAGQWDDAECYYRKSLQQNPHYAQAWNNLGSVLQQSQQWAEAEAAFAQALQLKPDYVLARYNLGLMYQRQALWQQAKDQYLVTLQLQPQFWPSHESLAEIEWATGHYQAAIERYHMLIAHHPQEYRYHMALGHCYQKQGAWEQAAQCYQTAFATEPHLAEACRCLGSVALAQSDYQEAVVWFQRALQIQPDHEEARVQMGHAFKEMGQMSAALASYEQARATHPGDRHVIRLATVLPPVYRNHADLSFWRQRFTTEVGALQGHPLKLADPLTEIGTTNFYLAYQGENDCLLQQQVAQLYRASLPESMLTDPRHHHSHRRIGLISGFFYNHSISHYYASLIAALAQSDRAVFLLAVPGMRQDEVTAHLQSQATQLLSLPHDLSQSRQLIADLALDILLYTDIGMEPFTYFLAFTRLAPIQCVLAGHPVTTGIPTIDYFVSHALTESANAQEHYSETLIQLPGLPVSYPFPPLPQPFQSRSELGLPDHQHLYVCPMTLFKIHPDYDGALAAILEQDPQGQILFFCYRETTLHMLLQQRFEHTIPQVAERIRFLPWATGSEFFSILKQADVILDSFHFGGGSTHFLSLATGTPLVTWQGPYLRGRSGAALLTFLGLTELIATQQPDFAPLAVNVALNPDYQQALREKILAAHPALYHNGSGVESLVHWLDHV